MKLDRSWSWSSQHGRVNAWGVSAGRVAMLSLTALAALASGSGATPSGIPDPVNCVADTCLLLAPAGNFSYRVVLRDESFAPVSAASVVLDFVGAPGIVLCSASDPDGDRRVEGLTDGTGTCTLQARGGGQSTGYVVVTGQGQMIRLAYPRSTDLNGDLVVTSADVTLHASLPASSRAGNYDCDSDCDAADRAVIQAEVGQDCATVPVLSSTWGRIKGFFR